MLIVPPERGAQLCQSWRSLKLSIGLVPTMGALHAGHLSLIRRSLKQHSRTVVTIFVNPLQFNDAQDFADYPQDFSADHRWLKQHAAGVDCIVHGSFENFFGCNVALEPVGLVANDLEGAGRPGHFQGVCTIVRRLFELIRPDVAYFGVKDLQQALLVRALAKKMGFPRIAIGATIREASGLALSSRNQKLSNHAVRDARSLYRCLTACRHAWESGEYRKDALKQVLVECFQSQNTAAELHYATVRNPYAWNTTGATLAYGFAMMAASFESVRLIDNLELRRADIDIASIIDF